jgi:hypothetical protein
MNQRGLIVDCTLIFGRLVKMNGVTNPPKVNESAEMTKRLFDSSLSVEVATNRMITTAA